MGTPSRSVVRVLMAGHGCHQIGDMLWLRYAGDRASHSETILGASPTCRGPIRAWFAVAAKARWANPAEIKRQFGGTVDFVGDNRVIFDFGGNKYRLVVHVSEYDRIDPKTVSWRKK
jgi:mRNA interferase HigB